MSVIFGVAVLITGSIWAKASWGHWWVWDEPTLVSFLIVFLLYATYYPFRYAIEDRERQARYASVFAITAGAFVPLNFMAVRLAESLVHPRTFATANGGLPGEMMLTFLVCLAAMALLWVTLVKFELTAKSASGQLKRLRRALDAPARRRGLPDRPGGELMLALLAAAPALPLDEAGKYVAGAYIVFLVLIVVYVAIMAAKLQRIERELRELADSPRAAPTASGRDRAAARGGRRLMTELLALGVSHKTAPLDLRERLALTEGRAVGALRELTAADGIHEAAAISTCNRTELYLVVSDPVEAESTALGRPHPPGGDPPDRAARPPLLAALDRRRPPPLPGHRRARLDDRRRGRDPGPGQARLRAGAGRGRAPGRSSTASSAAPSPPAAAPARRPGSARRASRSPRSRSSWRGARSATSPTGACWWSAPARPPSWSPGRWSPAASPPSSSPTATTTARSASPSASAAARSASRSCPSSSRPPTSSSRRPTRRTTSSSATSSSR